MSCFHRSSLNMSFRATPGCAEARCLAPAKQKMVGRTYCRGFLWKFARENSIDFLSIILKNQFQLICQKKTAEGFSSCFPLDPLKNILNWHASLSDTHDFFRHKNRIPGAGDPPNRFFLGAGGHFGYCRSRDDHGWSTENWKHYDYILTYLDISGV